MRHRKHTLKLGRKTEHRRAMLGNMVGDLILRRRITTTLAKAKAARSLAERMVTLGKVNTLHARRQAIRFLRHPERVGILFGQIAPVFTDRQGGYTRIIKLGRRGSDSAEMAVLEWVNYTPPAPRPKKEKGKDARTAAPSPKAAEKKPAKDKPADEPPKAEQAEPARKTPRRKKADAVS